MYNLLEKSIKYGGQQTNFLSGEQSWKIEGKCIQFYIQAGVKPKSQRNRIQLYITEFTAKIIANLSWKKSCMAF